MLIFQFFLNLVNIFSLKRIKPGKSKSDLPFISILLPVRNEEKNIEKCIRSILAQRYKNFELLVLNDNSTDSTGKLLSFIVDTKLRVIEGKMLEKGWIGKNFACHQLQKEARGEFLLFVDADIIMDKDCISGSLKFAVENKTGLLSLMPYERSITFWEKTVIPMLYFSLMVSLPLFLIEGSRRKYFSVGNGQFMLFSRSCYERIGGHESLKNKIVEDIFLAKRVKEFGEKIIFADGTFIVNCRMYMSLKEIWQGFSKNVYPGLSFSFPLLVTVSIFYLTFFVSPIFLLLYGETISSSLLINLSLASLFIPVIIRITHSIKYKQPLLFSFLNIIGCLFVICVAVN